MTGSSRSLVRPLIESLRHEMVVSDPWLQEEMNLPGRPFRDALADSVARSGGWKRPIVRSIQRLPLPAGRDAQWLGRAYVEWLSGLLPALIVVEQEGEVVLIRLRGVRAPLIRMRRRPSVGERGRHVLEIEGGLLAHPRPTGEPRLEFRTSPDGEGAIAALQDYAPRLPWWIYLWTQAPLHAAVMSAFRRWLRRHDGAASAPATPALQED